MIRYVVKRLIIIIPVIIALTFVVYSILYMAPGDPAQIILGNDYTEEAAAQVREDLGLDQPFIVQYFHYLGDLVRGDFGESYVSGESVGAQLFSRFPNTFKIVICAMIFCVAVGMPIGIWSAVRPNSIFSKVTMVIGLMGVSMPVFWLGLLLVLFFAVHLGWFSASGMDDGWKSLVLPSLTVGANYMANTMRTTRSSMMEAIRQDYITTARAKGVREHDVIYDHALGNALMPTITVVGLNVGALLGGLVYCETVFSIPGTGRFLVESINKRDVPCVLGCLVIMAICVAVSNLIVDLIYAYIDPRIKAQYSGKGGRSK